MKPVLWKVKPSEIDEYIHRVKATAQMTRDIEKICKRMRETLHDEVEKINDMIYEQVE